MKTFGDYVSDRLAEGAGVTEILRGWALGDGKEDVIALSKRNGKSLNRTLIGTVPFAGEAIKVFTVNGQFTRSPTGMDIIEFTMGGNWYGGTKKGTYWPICGEDEVALHELMPPVDMLATLVHEVIERYVMKSKGLSYDDAHSDYAEPAEKKARRILEGADWKWTDLDSAPLDVQFVELIRRIGGAE